MLNDNDIEIEEHEPQLTSLDPKERKLARKLRIERRWENIRRQAMSVTSVVEEETKGDIQLQVQKSAEILEKFIREGEEFVTNVRVANDAREVDRRETEGIGREKVIEQLENEASAAQGIFKNIADRWSIIENYKDPLLINEEIQSQKEKCDMLIKQKDDIITMLRNEIKTAERNFTRDQRKQMDDINILAQRIEKQVTFMRRAYQKEFELIEEVILTERKKLIDTNNKKWEELYKKREQLEIANSDKKFKQLDEFDGQMMAVRIDYEEKFRETYINLENDINTLQQQLERIRALAMLNNEKLDYNYQILKKREDENIIIKSQQKRRINKLQDVINDLRKKTHDYELSTNNLIHKLSDDIKKLHKSILLVEEKADHFAKVNNEKFNKIWELNRNSCQDILMKISETDKILHEQQMGVQWIPPIYHLTKMKHLASFKSAVAITGDCMTSPSLVSVTSSTPGLVRDKKNEEYQHKYLSSIDSHYLNMNPVYKRLLKYVLTKISSKSGFLTQNRLKELLTPYEDDQKTLVRLDNVFSSLGIHNKEDIEVLITYFLPYAHCPVCAAQSDLAGQASLATRYTSQMSTVSGLSKAKETENTECIELEQAYWAVQHPGDLIEQIVQTIVPSDNVADDPQEEDVDSLDALCGGAPDEEYATVPKEKATKKALVMEEKFLCEFNHQMVISPVYILKALREFVLAYYEGKDGLPTTGERLNKKRNTISRLLSKADIVKYWAKFKSVYNEDRIRVWDALFEGLKKYHEILKDRKILCEEVVDLRRQNRDLKRLLANYIDHAELLSPPCTFDHENFVTLASPSYTNAKRF